MVEYYKGDLLDSNCKVICHQVNCAGVMQGEVADKIKEKYPVAYKAFRLRHKNDEARLGQIDMTVTRDNKTDKETYIINIYAQRDYLPLGVNHTNYRAFKHCLRYIKWNLNNRTHWTIGFPAYIGCDEAGGDWEIIRKIIEEEFKAPKWKVQIWDNSEV